MTGQGYGWQRFYEAAILETNRRRLRVLLRAAHAAIDARLEQLQSNHQDSVQEKQAIVDALVGLRTLRRKAIQN